MSENTELARKGFEALMRGDLDAVEAVMAPNLVWHWWKHGPWDCHSRAEAMGVIRERIGQRAIRDLHEVIEVDDEHIVVVMRRRPDSEVSNEDLGLPEGHDETANLVTILDGKVVAMHDYRTKAEALDAGAERS